MRQIKFRAWDKTGQHPCMIEVESVMYDEFDKMSISGKPFDEDNGGFTHLEEGEFELLQFTGLQDKNGVEIYEGDIVESDCYSNGAWFGRNQPRTKYRVEYNNYKGGFCFKGTDRQDDSNSMEVIGNIHENKELLCED
jgi:uncharacterized phage protein (TIGR01671 family)